jgi:hypothetical protein
MNMGYGLGDMDMDMDLDPNLDMWSAICKWAVKDTDILLANGDDGAAVEEMTTVIAITQGRARRLQLLLSLLQLRTPSI